MKSRLLFFFVFISFLSVFAEEQLVNKMVVRVNGKVYTIQKSKNEYCEGSVIYGFSVWDNVVPGNGRDIAYSETKPDCVELKDGP